MCRREKADYVRNARERVGIAVRHTHAAADQQIVTEQLVAFGDDDEAEIIGEDIDVVQRRDGEGRFEFSRQIELSVERVNEFLGVIQLEFLALDPDFVIRACGRIERIRQVARLCENVVHQRAGGGSRRSHDVAFHVAAGGDGGDQRIVQPLDSLAQAGFDDPVELEVLAGCDAERVVCITGDQIVTGQVLFGAQDAAREFRTHHENPLSGHLPSVAVVLLVNAMEFQEFVIVVREVVNGWISQSLSNCAGEGGMGAFQTLISR